MQRSYLSIITILIFIILPLSIAAQKKTAVYVNGKISEDDKEIISSAIIDRLTSSREYAPFERSDAFLDALTREHDYQLSGEVSESQIRKIGQKYGVDYVLSVNVVMKYNDDCYMSARIINIETGAIIKSAKESRRNADTGTLVAMANKIVYMLTNH